MLELGISLLLLMAVWKFVYKPAVLDYTRDKLFDQRENFREFFINDLENPVYTYGRHVCNHHIRHIEEFSLIKLSLFGSAFDKDPELLDYVLKEYNSVIKNASKDEIEVLDTCLKSARSHVTSHMIFSSPVFLLIYWTLFISITANTCAMTLVGNSAKILQIRLNKDSLKWSKLTKTFINTFNIIKLKCEQKFSPKANNIAIQISCISRNAWLEEIEFCQNDKFIKPTLMSE